MLHYLLKCLNCSGRWFFFPGHPVQCLKCWTLVSSFSYHIVTPGNALFVLRYILLRMRVCFCCVRFSCLIGWEERLRDDLFSVSLISPERVFHIVGSDCTAVCGVVMSGAEGAGAYG